MTDNLARLDDQTDTEGSLEHIADLQAVEPDDGKHECPYLPCLRRVSPHLFACRAHWMKVPADLRAELYAAYDGRAARPYFEVREDCVKAMNER